MKRYNLNEKKEFKDFAILYTSIGILMGVPYVFDAYEDYLGNDFCMWNKGIVCNLESKLNEDLN